MLFNFRMFSRIEMDIHVLDAFDVIQGAEDAYLPFGTPDRSSSIVQVRIMLYHLSLFYLGFCLCSVHSGHCINTLLYET